MKAKKTIRPCKLATEVARFINESWENGDYWYNDNPTTNALKTAWAKMVAEIKSKLHFEQVAAAAARKYFPGASSKVAAWIAANVDLICKDGYPEDWPDFEDCIENFGTEYKITPTAMLPMMAKGVGEGEDTDSADE